MIEPQLDQQEETVTRSTEASSGSPQTRTTVQTTRTTTPFGFRARATVWLAVTVVDAILALDFIFKILAAGNVGFVAFIDSLATALSAPFRGVVASTVSTGHLAYWPDVVGIVVYTIAAAIVVGLIGIAASPRSRQHPV